MSLARRHLLHRLLPIFLLLALGACGSSDDDAPPAPAPAPAPADPLQPYRTQTLSWADCEIPSLDEDASRQLAQLGQRARCTTVRVPMDYADPARGDIQVAVLRIAATDSQQRQGAIFFNPGGPGEDGLATPLPLAGLFTRATADSPTGSQLLALSRTRDLIGFSPRGVGASTPLACTSDAQLLPVSADAESRTTQNIDDMLHNGRVRAEACLQQPMALHTTTDNTVQDMDLIRVLLGDERISFIGYSYGTWLGAWYARRYPDRVDRMVLDSNVDLSAGFQQFALDQPLAMQRILDEVLAPYAVRHPDAFGVLGHVDAIRELLRSTLRPALRDLARTDLMSSNHDQADNMLVRLLGAAVLEQTLRDHASAAYYDLLSAVTNATYSADAAIQDQARNTALLLLDSLLNQTPSPKPVSLKPEDAVFMAVQCNDSAFNMDPAFWIAQGARISREAPAIGDDGITAQPCLYWPAPRTTVPPLSAMQDLDVLMVQSQFDGATPAEGARQAFAQLPRASLIAVPGEFQHGIFPYGDDCVDRHVIGYLAGQAVGQRELTCTAKPLERDAPEPEDPEEDD